jgi:hypothetical protein
VPTEEIPTDAAIAKASAQLDEGLKTCRTVVDDYRAALSGQPGHNDNERPSDPQSATESAAEPVD